MKLEIEAKVRVNSLEPAAKKLRRLDAELIETVREEDLYFNSADGTLMKSDCGLRLRRRKYQQRQCLNIIKQKARSVSDGIKGDEKIILTYKGPRGKSIFKSRQEAQVEVGDFDAAKNILLGLGYKERLTVKKVRQIWRLDDCEVCLDKVRWLGAFVEVEGPNEKSIKKVLNKLDLDKNEHISKGYARMTAEKLNCDLKPTSKK